MKKTTLLHVNFLPAITEKFSNTFRKVFFMNKRSRSLQTTLFIAFFAILFVIFSTYSIYYVTNETQKIKQQAYDTIEQNVLTVSSFMDSEINALDTVAQNIAYSNLVKDHFYTYLNMPTSTIEDNYNSMQNTKVLTDLLVSIIGPNRPVDQIYLYSLDKGCFGSGLDNSTSNISVKDMDWYASIESPTNNKVIFCETDSRLNKFFSYDEGSYFLTYCLKFNKALFKDSQGIVEVKKTAASFNQNIKRLSNSGYNEIISIYNLNHDTIYPINTPDSNIDIINKLDNASGDILSSGVHFLLLEGKKHVFYYTSDYSGFTTIITVDNDEMLKPISEFKRNNTLIFIIFLALAFALSYGVSRIITVPIMKMYSQIQSFEMDKEYENSFEDVNTNIIELDTLYSALIEMQKRNRMSMEREIALHNQEMQSRMLALQSQMNPHFLYNSLATIQSMADEEMNDEIINMCQTISRILRYISSDKQLLVTVEEDLTHVKDYLSCMKIRYDDDLEYTINIPEEMNELLIPKLCLQLIAENSIKYATKSVRPPWKIEINGLVTSTYWEISIKDNGLGFKDEDIETINQKISYINETSLLPSLELNGMGLLNIYMRFKTLYKGNHIFRISNLATGGAIVTIGGDIMKKEDENNE